MVVEGKSDASTVPEDVEDSKDSEEEPIIE
jgi:hypothetical protein